MWYVKNISFNILDNNFISWDLLASQLSGKDLKYKIKPPINKYEYAAYWDKNTEAYKKFVKEKYKNAEEWHKGYIEYIEDKIIPWLKENNYLEDRDDSKDNSVYTNIMGNV